eukprot:4780139-Amphidinium_carterae.1
MPAGGLSEPAAAFGAAAKPASSLASCVSRAGKHSHRWRRSHSQPHIGAAPPQRSSRETGP